MYCRILWEASEEIAGALAVMLVSLLASGKVLESWGLAVEVP